MELIVAGLLCVIFVSASTVLVLRSQHSAQDLMDEALEVSRQVRMAQAIRISTLENRLLANNWQEFDALQRTPDEAAKTAFSEKAHAEAEAYTPAQEAYMRRLVNQGDDLEGEDTDDYEPQGAIIG